MPEGTRVRLLWLSKETPDRFGQGGQRRQFFQLRELAKAGVDVTVLTPASSQDDSSIDKFVRVIRYRRRRLRSTPSPDPVELALGGDFDRLVMAHAESLDVLRDRHAEIRAPWLVDFHNVWTRWYAERGDAAMVEMWRAIEAQVLTFADASLTCSRLESGALISQRADACVVEAPNGIGPEEWPDSAIGDRDPHTVGVYGSWFHLPNREGLVWFLSEVWPSVRAAVPSARLLVAGTGGPPEAARQADGVETVGRVESIPAFLGAVSVVAVPVLKGPGTPVKFAESLASGAAVTATADAASGNPDAPALTSNDPALLAAGITRLLQEPDEARRLGEQGRPYALAVCPWSVTQRPLVSWVLTGRFETVERMR